MKGRLDALLGQVLEQGGRDELAPVVRAQDAGLAVAGKERLQLGDHVAGADGASDPAAERKSGVLVDHVQDAQESALARAAGEEVVRPDVVGGPAARFQGALAAVP